MDMTLSPRSIEPSKQPPPYGDARLRVSDICLARNGQTVALLPDFELASGRSLALIGASGTGKTTALMAIALIHPPAAGKIVVDNVEPWKLSRQARDKFRGRKIGLIFQSFHLVDALSVQANIALAARCAGIACDHERLRYLLIRLGLDEIADRRADRVSHGQAQRVAIARALLNRPALILADEPTSALDNANTNNLLCLLKNLAVSEGAALVIATHDRRILDAVDETLTMGGTP